MANRKGVKVKRRRDVQIKKVKKYISKHIYSFVCGGALLLVLLIVIAVDESVAADDLDRFLQQLRNAEILEETNE